VIEMDHHSEVVIGANTALTYNVVIQATKRIVIGEGCLLANGASVVDGRHRYWDFEQPDNYRDLTVRPVTIGERVWVASKATVGADVGDRAVIAAGAVVTRPVPEYCVAGGMPAEVLQQLERPVEA
jgi:acetyltransferase-like isoleucine patch superfamily enzyme